MICPLSEYKCIKKNFTDHSVTLWDLTTLSQIAKFNYQVDAGGDFYGKYFVVNHNQCIDSDDHTQHIEIEPHTSLIYCKNGNWISCTVDSEYDKLTFYSNFMEFTPGDIPYNGGNTIVQFLGDSMFKIGDHTFTTNASYWEMYFIENYIILANGNKLSAPGITKYRNYHNYTIYKIEN